MGIASPAPHQDPHSMASPDHQGAGAIGSEVPAEMHSGAAGVRWPLLGIVGSDIPFGTESEQQLPKAAPDQTQPQPASMLYAESEGEYMPAPSTRDCPVGSAPASDPLPAADPTAVKGSAPVDASAPVDGSAPTGLGHWPALHFTGSSFQEFCSEEQQHVTVQQECCPAEGVHDNPHSALPPSIMQAAEQPSAPPRPFGASSPAADPASQMTGVKRQSACCEPGPEDLDDLLLEEQELLQHHQRQIQQERPQAEEQQRHEHQQQGEQQQEQQQQQAPAVQAVGPAAVQAPNTNAWPDDDDFLGFDGALQEQEEILRNLPPEPPPYYRPELEPEESMASPPSPKQRQQQHDDGIADLDAELDLLDEFQQESSGQHSRKRQRTAHAAAGTSVAGVKAAGGDAGFADDIDFGDELDDLFGEQDDAAADVLAQTEEPATTVLKPATLASLGAGTAGRTAAEALAALEAAALRPRQLASAVTGCCLTVTGSSGQRVYCQLAAARPAEGAAAGAAAGGGVCRSAAGLLAEPIDKLLLKLTERRRMEVMAEYEAAQALADEINTLVNQQEQPADIAEAADVPAEAPVPEPQPVRQPSQQQHLQQQQATAVPRQLWVDKYAPKRFLQLLSEPRTNREIAAWMAKWKQQHPEQQQQPQQQKQQPQTNSRFTGADRQHQQQQSGRGYGRGGDGGGQGGGRGADGNIVKGFDAARYQAAQAARAAAKMLLVVGPPGTGKTTLAHVLAAQCGFRVVEINASDERTAGSLTRRITDAAQMTHVLEGTKHPPCIVLDELDGALGGTEGHSASAAILKLITGDSTGGKRKRGAKAGGRSKQSHGLGVPVIATANDAYAPCLRPLRDVAAIYHFKPPGPDRLMSRLSAIAKAEQLVLDRQALSALVDRSGCDIRTAINTLQLLARQDAGSKKNSSRASQISSQRAGRVTITAAAVHSSGALGLKDVSHTPLGVLQELLTAGAHKAMAARLHQLAAATANAVQRNGGSSSKEAAVAGAAAATRLQLQEQYNMLMDLGEHELVMSGIHEHLPEVVGLDVDLASTAAATAALADADRLMAGGVTSNSGGRGMAQYVPACVLAAARLAKREGGGMGGSYNLSWPRAQAECSRVAASNRALIRSWRASAPASAAVALGGGGAALLDFVPALSAISRPAGIKAVSRQLLSTQQAALLDHVVNVLVSCGLTYSFPAEDSDHQLAPGYAAAPNQQLPRPAPISPAIDTLHVYSTLGQSGASTVKPAGSSMWGSKVMPLVLRQMMAQMISAANILRLDKARHGGELASPTAGKTPGKAKPRTQQQQQQQAGPPRALDHRAAAKAAALPNAKPKPAGTWLDALKARTAPKRKAHGRGAPGPAAKRPAVASGVGTAADADEPAGGQEAAAGYTVLYKFNEGYTNAVKRPMKVSEWLL